MKTIFFIIIIILAIFIYAAKPSISISPFKVSVERPAEFFGLLFLALSIGFIRYQSEKDGFRKGVEKSIEVVQESYKEKNNK